MPMDASILTERQKEYLRTLVKLVREENLEEEFYMIYGADGNAHISSRRSDDDKDEWTHWTIERLTRITMEALTQAGYIFSLPDIENRASEFGNATTTTTSERGRYGYITPKGFRAVDNNFAPIEDLIMHRAPVEITASLAKFREDYPDPTRLAFIMMQFGQSKAHTSIIGAVRSALQDHGFIALRADDKEYHDDLFFNILTYIYGCRFGIAIFERIDDNTFNPNVSLEVGYMTGIGRPVCYLKDKTLPSLQSDLIGKLYRQFDAHDPGGTIPMALTKWMRDRGLLPATPEKKG
jgi:hypothetical protein